MVRTNKLRRSYYRGATTFYFRPEHRLTQASWGGRRVAAGCHWRVASASSAGACTLRDRDAREREPTSRLAGRRGSELLLCYDQNFGDTIHDSQETTMNYVWCPQNSPNSPSRVSIFGRKTTKSPRPRRRPLVGHNIGKPSSCGMPCERECICPPGS